MDYNDKKLYEILSTGWMSANSYIDWKNTCPCELKEYNNNVVKYGIKPMLRDLIDNSENIKIDTHKVCLLEKDIFAKFMIITMSYTENDPEFDNVRIQLLTDDKKTPLFSNGTLNVNNISLLYDNIVKLPKSPLKDDLYKELLTIQGYAYKDFQIINKDSALPELGLHLLCHELMHTIADKVSVEKLREKKANGDEDVNEYFARLASRYLKESGKYESILGSTTTEEMKNTKNDENHNEHGVYGVLLDKGKRFQETTMTLKKLQDGAKFYFQGGKFPEYFNVSSK